MRTTTFTFFDYLPDSVREMPRRRAAEALGLLSLACVGAASVALLSWSVSDPSLDHATSAPIHNWLGRPGAIGSDLAMQFLGLACTIALVAPACWAWQLMTERRLQRFRLRLALALIGAGATAACASLLPPPASWPLPTGLGGVAGDALLWLPRHIFPASTTFHALAGLAFAAVAILSLSASVGYGLPAEAEPAPAATTARAPRRAPDPVDAEDDDSDGEPGFGLVSLGAVIHTLLTLKSAARRLMAPRSPKARARMNGKSGP